MSAVYIDESGTTPKHHHRSTSIDPLSDPFNCDSNHISSPVASHYKFTAQDDRILQAFVAEAKRQNMELLSRSTWAKLERKVSDIMRILGIRLLH